MVLTLLLACRAVKDSRGLPVDSARESAPAFDSAGSDSPVETGQDSGESAPLPVDADGDGYAADLDCDDSDTSRHPDADERCDQVDNDCDGENTLCSDAMADITIRTVRDVDGFAYPAEFAGDVDGDGRDDLLIEDLGNWDGTEIIGDAQVLVRAQDLTPGDNDEAAVRWTYAYGRDLVPIGDLDEDGRDDLLVVGERDDTVGIGFVTDISMILGVFDEDTLSAWWSSGVEVGDGGVGALGRCTADVDGDGIPEFDFEGPDGATYLISTGVFRSGANLLDDAVVVDHDGYSLTSLGDLDGDGLADLSLAESWAAHRALFYSGAGLVPGTVYTEADADRVYVGPDDDDLVGKAGALPDLDGDGVGDLGLVATYTSWILSPGSAETVDDAFVTVISTENHRSLQLGDAGDQDGDGATDLLVVGYNWADTHDGALGLWSGPEVRGTLTFEEGAAFWLWTDAAPFHYYSLPNTTGDVNADGQLDLLFGNEGEREAYVMYGPLVE